MQHPFISQCIGFAHTANAECQFDAAIKWCNQALAAEPNLAEAWFNLGIAYRGNGQTHESIAAFEKTAKLASKNPEALNSVGYQLIESGALSEAETHLRAALKLAPRYAFAHSNLGILLQKRNRLKEAEASLRKAIELQPKLSAAYTNLAGVLNSQLNYPSAVAAGRKAVQLDPESAHAWHNLGRALAGQKNYAAAHECLSKCARIKPDFEFVAGELFRLKMLSCDWEGRASETESLSAQILSGKPVCDPFTVLGAISDPAVQLAAAKTYAAHDYPAQAMPLSLPERGSDQRIRIGYFSADFHNHATAYLMAELFEVHDKTKFELVGFSFGPKTDDDMQRRIARNCDQFIDVRDLSDREIAQKAREIGIDIAVDLKGYTENARTGIFAHRVAPIQVNYLGYPGTMGSSYFDYLIADQELIPAESRSFYTEKIVYLPDTYQVNDAKREISSIPLQRTDFGLPEHSFVFCCFNNNYKISPRTFDSWMRILARVEGSVLWLLRDNETAEHNLRREAERRQVDPGRLIFSERLPLPAHLARHKLANLCLDTLPYSAHTTASDALWAGLPIITQRGESFAGRVCASLLKAIGLPELITECETDYETLAVALANNPQQLQSIAGKLETNRQRAPLFDCRRFAAHIETAYEMMLQRHLAGLPPDHISLQ